MKLAEIEIVLGKYIMQEVIPNIPSTLERFMIGAGATLFIGKGEVLLNKYTPILKSMDIIDVEGNVDIDKLYTASIEGMKASGGKIEYKGMTFNQTDIDKLYSMLKGV